MTAPRWLRWSVVGGAAYALSLWLLSKGEPGYGITRIDIAGVGFALLLLVIASAANARRWGVLSVALCFGLGAVAAFYLFAAFADPTTWQQARISLRYVAGGALVTAAIEAALLTDWGRRFRRTGQPSPPTLREETSRLANAQERSANAAEAANANHHATQRVADETARSADQLKRSADATEVANTRNVRVDIAAEGEVTVLTETTRSADELKRLADAAERDPEDRDA